jgi:hypothetical protein
MMKSLLFSDFLNSSTQRMLINLFIITFVFVQDIQPLSKFIIIIVTNNAKERKIILVTQKQNKKYGSWILLGGLYIVLF